MLMREFFHALRPGPTEEKWRKIAHTDPVGPHQYSRKNLPKWLVPGVSARASMNHPDSGVVDFYILDRSKTGARLELDTLTVTNVVECG